MENLITTTNHEFFFKSNVLNAYSRQIAELGDTVASANVELSKILGKVQSEQCFKEDGFKSVAEYAEQTFGIKRANAYQLARVGARFLNSDSETAKQVSGMLPVSCLAEIVGMTDEEIEDALESGEIDTDTTQKELREVSKKVQESKNPKATVEKAKAIKAVVITAGRVVEEEFKGSLSVFVASVLEDKYTFTDCVIKTMTKDKELEVVSVLSADGDFAKVELRKFTPAPVEPASKVDNLLKSLTMEEIEALLAKVRGEEG